VKPSGRWFLDDSTGEVRLKTDDGNVLSPSAIDIWAAEFDLEQSIEGVLVDAPSAELQNIDFAPESPNIRIVLIGDDDRRIVAVLQIEDSDQYVHHLPASDQLLHEGRWYCLDSDEMGAIQRVLVESAISLGVGLSSGQVLNLAWKKEVEIKDEFDNSMHTTPDASVGTPLIEATLYDYQVIGVNKIIDLYNQGFGALLADEMGLGKTLQVIACIAHARATGQALVVCPASTLANWKREIRKFAPTLSVHIHQGPERAGAAKYLTGVDVVLTSYETMNQDIYVLRGVEWSIVAFDEAQYLKNLGAARTKSAKLLVSKGKIAVTGTPIENSLRDLWSITELLVPGLLPELDEFLEDYPDEDWAAHVAGKNIAPITIRRSVRDVETSLPERVDTFVPVLMGREHAIAYQEILDSDRSSFAKITTLRTISASMEFENTKIEYMLDALSNALRTGKKILIFASYTKTIEDLKAKLVKEFETLAVSIINGQTNINDRQKIIDRFTEEKQSTVLILNPRAAGVGLNIQAANYVFHFTPEWNPAIVDQASARAYRNGQKQTVFVYYLYYSNTIEEVMIERLERKRSLQASGLEGASAGPTAKETELVMSLSPERN